MFTIIKRKEIFCLMQGRNVANDMKKLDNPKLLSRYIQKYQLESVCGFKMADVAQLYQFDKKEYILRCEKKSNYIFFLIDGKIKVFSYTLSSRTLCRNFSSGLTLLGEAATLWGNYPTNNVQTLSTCICIGIDLRDNRELLLNDVTFLQFISKTLASRITNDMATHLLDSLEVQLASFILSVSDKNVFSFNLTEGATILNVSYRHFLRTLKLFCDNGYIEKRDNKYFILDRQALEEISNGETVL